jgi:hypothetical protein
LRSQESLSDRPALGIEGLSGSILTPWSAAHPLLRGAGVEGLCGECGHRQASQGLPAGDRTKSSALSAM